MQEQKVYVLIGLFPMIMVCNYNAVCHCVGCYPGGSDSLIKTDP